MICSNLDRGARRERCQLTGRHARQFGARADDEVRRLSDTFALTFRPGDRTDTFYEKTLRPLGAAVCVALSYDAEGREIWLSGVRGIDCPDGQVRYGTQGRREFQYDVRLPHSDHRGQRLPFGRNPSLANLAFRMDDTCHRKADARLPTIPRMPRVLFGFPRSEPPQYEATDGLLRMAAGKLGVSLRRLMSNPSELVDRLVRQTWEEVVAKAAVVDSGYGLLLIDAELCPAACRPLRIFEDFGDLVGDWTWNPVRGLTVVQAPNPARAAMSKIGLTSDQLESVTQPQLDELMQQMRTTMGDSVAAFDDLDLMDAIVEPDEPVIACSALLGRMRKRLTQFWNSCVVDHDLRHAARHSSEPLYAAGACRIQVMQRTPEARLRFKSDDLERRVELDLEPIKWPVGASAERNVRTSEDLHVA